MYFQIWKGNIICQKYCFYRFNNVTWCINYWASTILGLFKTTITCLVNDRALPTYLNSIAAFESKGIQDNYFRKQAAQCPLTFFEQLQGHFQQYYNNVNAVDGSLEAIVIASLRTEAKITIVLLSKLSEWEKMGCVTILL